jgi:O-antigen/teichoic acid export membrane protein
MAYTPNSGRMLKNTFILYFRMALMMCISLYTSRVVLQTLGVEDYGIYNVVGGVVVMFTFLNDGMTVSTLRFLTFELGKDNQKRLNEIFVTSLHIHLVISAVIVLLSETVGLWFLTEKLVIPLERMTAAHWCFQLSVFTCVVSIMSYPYNAAIVAHEKMSAFAYISILDAILKLLLVYLLLVFSMDRLILYAILFAAEKIMIRMVYNVYCTRHFEECHYRWLHDSQLFRQMFSFAGWSMWGNMAYIAYSQGLNMLLNIFFGPVVNAARAVAVQVQGAVSQLSSNFQMAINPQITKTYASGMMDEMHTLIYRSTRFTFCLLLLLCLPIFIEAPMLLHLWLGDVPAYSVAFLRLLLLVMIVDQMANPLAISVNSTGNNKKYEFVNGCLMLSILPISYYVLYLGAEPWAVFTVHLCISFIACIVRFCIVKPMIHLRIGTYFSKAVGPCLLVMALSCIVPVILLQLTTPSLLSSILTFIVTLVMTGIVSYLFGLDAEERSMILSKLVKLKK